MTTTAKKKTTAPAKAPKPSPAPAPEAPPPVVPPEKPEAPPAEAPEPPPPEPAKKEALVTRYCESTVIKALSVEQLDKQINGAEKLGFSISGGPVVFKGELVVVMSKSLCP